MGPRIDSQRRVLSSEGDSGAGCIDSAGPRPPWVSPGPVCGERGWGEPLHSTVGPVLKTAWLGTYRESQRMWFGSSLKKLSIYVDSYFQMRLNVQKGRLTSAGAAPERPGAL